MPSMSPFDAARCKIRENVILMHLNLHLDEAMLPDGNEGCGTILTVVHENNPAYVSGYNAERGFQSYIPSGSIDSPM